MGAIYGQGKEWQNCHPAGFLSRKFSDAQHHYKTHEHETIAVLKALMKWEDKLLGQKFVLVTDHKGLEYFKTQKTLSARQVRWWEFLSRFDYDTLHVKGVDNKVADCLSHYYENDLPKEDHPEHIYVNTDVRLDPTGDLLPTDRFVELHSAASHRSKQLQEQTEERVLESEALQVDKESHSDSGDIIGEGDNIEAINASNDGLELRSRVESGINLVKLIQGAYRKDAILSKVLEAPREHPRFGVRDDLIWTKNPYRCDVICIP